MIFKNAVIFMTFAPSAFAINNVIQITSTQLLGNQTSSNDPGTYRDAGYESQIGNTYFQFYADTLNCNDQGAVPNNPSCTNFRANSIALSTSNPQQVKDFVTPYPAELCHSPVSSCRLHFTNVISMSSTTGVAWYGNISSDTSNDIDGAAISSGIATIIYTGSGSPTCKVQTSFWGIAEPLFGDHGVVKSPTDGYIYLLGSLGADTGGYKDMDIFLARVAPVNVGSVSGYQYWNGSAFTSTRLVYPDYNGYAPAAVLINSGSQGAIFYSNYYKRYIYLTPGGGLSGQITAQTAAAPQGPWSPTTVLFQANGIPYAPVPQTHFDTSGKTLIFDYSLFESSTLQTVKVTFK